MASSVLNDIYKVYITYKGEDILLPQTPDSIEISNEDKTASETLVKGRPFTYGQLDGPQTFKFNFEITKKTYPYTFKEAVKGIRFFTDLVWYIKQDREPIELTIIRTHDEPSTHVKVFLQDYPYKEEADNLSDYIFSVTFIEYHPQKNQELPYVGSSERHHLLVAGDSSEWSSENKGAQQDALNGTTADEKFRESLNEHRQKEWDNLAKENQVA